MEDSDLEFTNTTVSADAKWDYEETEKRQLGEGQTEVTSPIPLSSSQYHGQLC